MDLTEDVQRASSMEDGAQPTDVPDLVPVNRTKATNGTKPPHIEANDENMRMIADWMNGKNLPSLKSIFVGVATAVHLVVSCILEYLLWNIVFTLAVVEAPQVVVPAPAPWTDKKTDGDKAPKVHQERSITKSVRTTVRHLCAVGGYSALCRGLALYISYMFVNLTGSGFAWFLWTIRRIDFDLEDHETPGPLEWTLRFRLEAVFTEAVLEIASNMLLCSWIATWVHVVISQPTLRIWYRRLPPFMQVLRATWLPLLILPLVRMFFVEGVATLLRHYLDLYGESNAAAGIMTVKNAEKMLVWFWSRSLNAFTMLTIEAALIRVQASLLPEEEETIIPFDRSFGLSGASGHRPGLLAESSGVLSFGDAWKSITWMEMRRLAIVALKILAVQAVVGAVFWPAVGNKVWPDSWVPFDVPVRI